MVNFILGPQGSGKTKWLIEKANHDMKVGNGNIIFIDVDDNHIFRLNSAVRLINAMEFNIKSIESLYGFLCGIIGSDYDVERIYVDGIYKAFPLTAEDLEILTELLNPIGREFKTEFYIGVDHDIDDIPKGLKDNCIELTIE